MQHLLLLSSWFVGWGSAALGLFAKLPRFWVVVFLALAAWAVVITGAVMVVNHHAVLLRATEELGDLRLMH